VWRRDTLLRVASLLRAMAGLAAFSLLTRFLIIFSVAHAADITVVQLERHDQADNGYRADLGDYSPGSNLSDDTEILCNLRLTGDIEAGDYDKLVALLPASSPDWGGRLCLSSRGGNYAEALRIAELLIDRGVGTAVEANAICYSSCAIIFMSGSGFGFYKLNMFLHVKAKLGFHAPYIGDVPQAAYDNKTVENTFSAAVSAIRKLMKLDPTRFSASFLTQMLEKGPEETFDIDTVGKVVEHRISLYGARAPNKLAARNFCFACFYDLGATSQCELETSSQTVPGGIQYTVDTFRGGECVAEARMQGARVTGWRLVKFSYDTSPMLPYWFLYAENTPIARLAPPSRQEPKPSPSVQPPRTNAFGQSDEPRGTANDRIAWFVEREYLRDLEQYASQVDYYDKGIVGQDFIARDKSDYARKWPSRDYRMIPGSLRISAHGPKKYAAEFSFTYIVANGSKRKSGRGATRIVIQERDGRFLILGVKEALQR